MSRVRQTNSLISENEHNLNAIKRLRQELNEVTEDRNQYKLIFEEVAYTLVNNKQQNYTPDELLKIWDSIRTKHSK